MKIYFNDFNFYIKKHVANIKYIYYFVKTKKQCFNENPSTKKYFFSKFS